MWRGRVGVRIQGPEVGFLAVYIVHILWCGCGGGTCWGGGGGGE